MSEVANADERFRVKVDGPDDAPVILMSHSLGCDLTMWDDVVPTLAQKYRVVRYDTRGHGGSVVVDRPTSIAELADDALAILDDLNIERAHFVGLSMGGMIGQWLLRHAPERLDRVVLCNTSALMAPPDLWNARIRTARESGMKALLSATMERWFTAEFRAKRTPGLARVAAMYEGTNPAGFASCCAAIRDMDQRWPLRSVIGDVTVLVGARDPGTTPVMGKLIADAIPGARLVTLDTAHISAVERPDDFAAAILAALAAPVRRAPRAAKRKAAPAPRQARVPARARGVARRAAAASAAASSGSARSTAAKAAAPKAGAKAGSAKTGSAKTGSAKTGSAKTGSAKPVKAGAKKGKTPPPKIDASVKAKTAVKAADAVAPSKKPKASTTAAKAKTARKPVAPSRRAASVKPSAPRGKR